MANTSAGAKKAYATKLAKYGEKKMRHIARKGGKKKTRGHFGKLKDEGKFDEIRNYSKQAVDTKKQKHLEKVYDKEIW